MRTGVQWLAHLCGTYLAQPVLFPFSLSGDLLQPFAQSWAKVLTTHRASASLPQKGLDMKHVVTLAATLIATGAYANDSKVTDDDICRAWGSLAVKIMGLRQSEAPMSRAMELAGTGSESQFARHIVMKAYEIPAQAEPYRRRQADAFRNKIELECFKAKD